MRDFRRTVLSYWRAHGRHALPWRRTHDPYTILVSELMLQQTQVDRVVPYFTRWMEIFPTPAVLAEASLPEVLRLWSGLGYNRRAKFLHEAAKKIVAVHAGAVPHAYAELRALPGVGEYTAKAVRVFAFNEPEVLIETNVRSVFIHHFLPRARRVDDARLMPCIAQTLDRRHPRRWYSALMDYGVYIKSLHPNLSRKSKHHAKQSEFEGSLRQVRGAILRAHVAKSDITKVRAAHPARFEEAYRALVREGLIDAAQ